MRTLSDNLAIRQALDPASYNNVASVGDWIAMRGFRRCLFVVNLGATTGAVTVQVQEATDASGTGAQDISGLTGSFTATDDNKLGIIEVRAEDLSEGYTHVAVEVTPAAAGTLLAATAILGEPYSAPVSNAAADGVVFDVGE
ncbi:MAG: hypothetical protein KatS3mg051_1425 [Anaerolineae bacterium]|nr:MAG: hypothetical protein KatS3mg051_1425 [Anaerolineae bacterium]